GVGPGALAGGYVGASAGAAIGVGVAANGLVGGLNNSFALQPLSFEGQTGLHAIATVTGLDLRPVMPVRHPRRHPRFGRKSASTAKNITPPGLSAGRFSSCRQLRTA